MLFAVFGLLLPTLLGFKRYVITGESMTGTIPKGSIIYSRLTPLDELRPGDIITFVPPDIATPVTHRIARLSHDEDGHVVFQTKGDFNASADPWRLHLVDPAQAKYWFHIPYLGYLLAMLATRQVRMLLIGVPAIVIALSLLWSLWRQGGEELARREAQRGVAPGGDCEAAAVAAEWDGPDPFGGRSEAELAHLRGWWQ
jgi:signal peptidase